MDKTIKVLRQALEANPSHWETRRHVAELLISGGNVEDARALLAEAPEVPQTVDDQLFVAQFLLESDPAAAAPFVDHALRLDKSSARAHWLKACVFQKLGLREDARKHYTTAVVLDDTLENAAFEAWMNDGGVPAGLGEIPDTSASIPMVEPVPETVPALEPPPKPAASTPLIVPAAATAPLSRPTSKRKVKARPKAASKKVKIPVGYKGDSTAVAMKEKRKSQTAAFFIAGVLHALLVLGTLYWFLKPEPLPSPSFIVNTPPPDQLTPEVVKRSVLQQLKPDPSSSSASRAQVVAANTLSPLAVPEVQVEELTEDIIGAGDTFGMGTGWGQGDGGGGGGSVRFFGQEKVAKRVCYVVDFSGSMAAGTQAGDTRIGVLKKELSDSIQKLNPTLRFCVICFSGGAWTMFESPTDPKYLERIGNAKPRANPKWIEASAKNKTDYIERIKQMPLAPPQGRGAGTLWVPALMAAMELKQEPDVLFLLTDGDASDAREAIDRVNEIVPGNVPVNAISMELPGSSAKNLLEIADKTGGDFSIQLDGNEYTGERARAFTDPKYNPPQ